MPKAVPIQVAVLKAAMLKAVLIQAVPIQVAVLEAALLQAPVLLEAELLVLQAVARPRSLPNMVARRRLRKRKTKPRHCSVEILVQLPTPHLHNLLRRSRLLRSLRL